MRLFDELSEFLDEHEQAGLPRSRVEHHVDDLVCVAVARRCQTRGDVATKVCCGDDEKYLDRVWPLVQMHMKYLEEMEFEQL